MLHSRQPCHTCVSPKGRLQCAGDAAPAPSSCQVLGTGSSLEALSVNPITQHCLPGAQAGQGRAGRLSTSNEPIAGTKHLWH